ncbi:MAG: hypothetical protein EOP09_20005, partial [Proteobacteria bacterium]
MKKALLVLLPLTFLACAQFNRSVDSGYSSRTPKVVTTYSATSSPNIDADTSRVAYELGYNPTSLSSEELLAVQKRKQLKGLEKALDSRQEKEQYSKVLPWLKDDEEKIEFLNIPSLEGRQAWINKNDVWARSRVPVNRMKNLIEAQDIAVGMPMEYVKRAWGDPASVDVSGNPVYKNERWKYVRSVPGNDGFHQQKRSVYFEGGRVVGWD